MRPDSGFSIQPIVPSYAWVMVIPWIAMSMRIDFGRFISSTIGASIPGPTVIRPVIRTDCTAFCFARPPFASLFFAMMSSTVCAAAGMATSAASPNPTSSLRTIEASWESAAIVLEDGDGGPRFSGRSSMRRSHGARPGCSTTPCHTRGRPSISSKVAVGLDHAPIEEQGAA